MKKLGLLLLFPLLLATQCEDDDSSGFETTYFIQNDSTINLLLLTENDAFTEINGQTSVAIGSTLNSETNAVLPSESFIFNRVKLYQLLDGDFILRYEQEPLDDASWSLSEPTQNRFEYTLLITDDDLD